VRLPFARSNSRLSIVSAHMAHDAVETVWMATCGWRIVISPIIPSDFPSCYDSAMRNLAVLFIHFSANTWSACSDLAAFVPLVAESLSSVV